MDRTGGRGAGRPPGGTFSAASSSPHPRAAPQSPRALPSQGPASQALPAHPRAHPAPPGKAGPASPPPRILTGPRAGLSSSLAKPARPAAQRPGLLPPGASPRHRRPRRSSARARPPRLATVRRAAPTRAPAAEAPTPHLHAFFLRRPPPPRRPRPGCRRPLSLFSGSHPAPHLHLLARDRQRRQPIAALCWPTGPAPGPRLPNPPMGRAVRGRCLPVAWQRRCWLGAGGRGREPGAAGAGHSGAGPPGRGMRGYKGGRRRGAAILVRSACPPSPQFPPPPRPRSGPWCRRTSTMSLSRSEEMHRLTENVYKVSPATPAPSGPTQAAAGPRGPPARQRDPGACRSQVGAGAPPPAGRSRGLEPSGMGARGRGGRRGGGGGLGGPSGGGRLPGASRASRSAAPRGRGRATEPSSYVTAGPPAPFVRSRGPEPGCRGPGSAGSRRRNRPWCSARARRVGEVSHSRRR